MDICNEIENVAGDLTDRVSNFPGPTCPKIDGLIADLAPVRSWVDSMSRRDTEWVADNAVDVLRGFAEADRVIWEMPGILEELREANDALRSALHEALDSRSSAAGRLKQIAKDFEPFA